MKRKTTAINLALAAASGCGTAGQPLAVEPEARPTAVHTARARTFSRDRTPAGMHGRAAFSTLDPVVAARMNTLILAPNRESRFDPTKPQTIAEACGGRTGTLYFDTASTRLTEPAEAQVEALARCLNGDSLDGDPVLVVGYTDPRGLADDNLELGLERAIAVKHELVAHGVRPDRIETDSRGESQADHDGFLQDDRRAVVKLDR